MTEKIWWMDFYKELAEKLLDYKDKRNELIDIINDFGLKGIPNNKKLLLLISKYKNIDPFTFLSFINKGITASNKIRILSELKSKFDINLEVPNTFDGIPTADNRKQGFGDFSLKNDDDFVTENIDLLWKLFENIITNKNISEEFNKAINIKDVGPKITTGMFWIAPEKYISIDNKNYNYISNLLGKKFILRELKYEGYIKLISEVKEKIGSKSFVDISVDAYKKEDKPYNPKNKGFTISNVWIEKRKLKNISSNKDDLFYIGNSLYSNEKGKKDRDIYKNMRFVNRDDYIFHLLDNKLFGISRVKEEYKIEKHNNNENYIVRLEKFTPFNKNNLDIYDFINANKEKLSEIYKNNKNLFFDKNLNIRQGAYLTNIPKDLLNLLIDYLNKKGISLEVNYMDREIKDSNNLINKNIKSNSYVNDKLITEATNLLQNKKQIILYGPPGTGKTWNTKQIIENFENINNKGSNKTYDELIKERRVQFITFHQSYSYEDFVEGIKPKLDQNIVDNDDENLKYELKDGIFKKMCNLSLYNLIKANIKHNQNIVDFSFDSIFLNLIDKLENEDINKIETRTGMFMEIIKLNNNGIYLKHENKKDREYIVSKKILEVLYNSLESPKDENLKNIKNINKWVRSVIKGCNASAYYSVLKYILENNIDQDVSDSSNNEEEGNIDNFDYIISNYIKEFYKNTNKYEKQLENDTPKFYLIVDEINRGNISKILGELITLIEKDKRLGQENKLIVKLPYSNDEFSVPSNLYIIGTMNTADKSLTSLDIALRRRFGFVEMSPNYDALNFEINKEIELIKGINLDKLLSSLNERIELILDKDHLIGHSYFMSIKNENELKDCFYYEIIPLLQEYFYNDWEKLKFVIGEEFLDFNEYTYKDNDLIDEEKKLYFLKSIDKINFLAAFKEIISNYNKNMKSKNSTKNEKTE